MGVWPLRCAGRDALVARIASLKVCICKGQPTLAGMAPCRVFPRGPVSDLPPRTPPPPYTATTPHTALSCAQITAAPPMASSLCRRRTLETRHTALQRQRRRRRQLREPTTCSSARCPPRAAPPRWMGPQLLRASPAWRATRLLRRCRRAAFTPAAAGPSPGRCWRLKARCDCRLRRGRALCDWRAALCVCVCVCVCVYVCVLGLGGGRGGLKVVAPTS